MSANLTQFEASPGALVLQNAILLYRPERTALNAAGQADAFASYHPVEQIDGQPVIGAGTPLSRDRLRAWSQALGKSAPPEILPDNMLIHHPDMMAWWVPAKRRASYFALSNPPKDLTALAQRTVVDLPYPAHLLVATRTGLAVFALRESRRPAADTPLLHSPILNVFLNGSLCWGNIRKPRALNIAAMADYERALFDSWSTHPNPGQESTVTGKGGLVRLWDDLAARKAKRFPVARLKPFNPWRDKRPTPYTLADVLVQGSRR